MSVYSVDSRRLLIVTLTGWLLAFAAIVGIAWWLHRTPEILVTVDRRLPSRAIENAKTALAEGRYGSVLQIAPDGIAFNADLRERFMGKQGVEQWQSAMAMGHALMAMAYLGRDAEGDGDRAITELEAALELGRGLSAGRYLYEYGRLLTQAGRAGEAEPVLVEALQRGNGGWVPEVQTIRARIASEAGKPDVVFDCLYDLIRFTSEPLPDVAVPPLDDEANAKALYVHAVLGMRRDESEAAKRYLAAVPEDRVTSAAMSLRGLDGGAAVSLPFEIPLEFNYRPPGMDAGAGARFGVPGGTILDFLIHPDWSAAVLELDVSVDFIPPKPLQLNVLIDGDGLHSFTFDSTGRQVYAIDAPRESGLHRAAIRVEGETFNLESIPNVTLHRIALRGPDGGA